METRTTNTTEETKIATGLRIRSRLLRALKAEAALEGLSTEAKLEEILEAHLKGFLSQFSQKPSPGI